MHKLKALPVLAVVTALASCGGGGSPSGVVTTPAPPPAQTPAPPPNINSLTANQSFTTSSASAGVSVDAAGTKTTSSSVAVRSLSVSYDAASVSYTVSSGSRAQTFASGDIQASNARGVGYAKSGANGTDYLLFLKSTSTTGNVPLYQYVRAGVWEDNTSSNTQHDWRDDFFVYGYRTSPGGLPRSGSVTFTVQTLGIAATPGEEPVTFDGGGRFDADFLTGVFSANLPIKITGVVSNDPRIGGGLELVAGGHLTSDAGFTGNLTFGGLNPVRVGGTVSGGFYGPAGEEVGAQFSGTGASGTTFAGTFVGQKAINPYPAVNQTLTNLVAPQRFGAPGTLVQLQQPVSNPATLLSERVQEQGASIDMQLDGSFIYNPGISSLPTGTWSAANRVGGNDPNFTSYRQNLFTGSAHVDVTLDVFRSGPSNTELALTYLSLARWNTVIPDPYYQTDARQWTIFGLPTGTLLNDRTGTAHYDGIARGDGTNVGTQARYSVTGASSFDVDFTHRSYSGALTLNGQQTNGSASVAFGRYEFQGAIGPDRGQFRAGVVGQITPTFYGPDGEEIGAQFYMGVPTGAPGAGTIIAGVAAAKR